MTEDQELQALEAEINALEQQAEVQVQEPAPVPEPAPVVEAPKADKPKKEKPKAEAPKAEAPKKAEVLYGAAKVKAKFLKR